MVEIGGEDGVRVELHAAEIDDPEKAGGVVYDDFLGGAAGRKAEGDGAEECGRSEGARFLIEGLGLAGGEAGSVDEALEDDGTALNAEKRARCDGCEVLRDVELGEVGGAVEVRLGGTGDADLLVGDGEEYGVVGLGHGRGMRRPETSLPGQEKAYPGAEALFLCFPFTAG